MEAEGLGEGEAEVEESAQSSTAAVAMFANNRQCGGRQGRDRNGLTAYFPSIICQPPG